MSAFISNGQRTLQVEHIAGDRLFVWEWDGPDRATMDVLKAADAAAQGYQPVEAPQWN